MKARVRADQVPELESDSGSSDESKYGCVIRMSCVMWEGKKIGCKSLHKGVKGNCQDHHAERFALFSCHSDSI